MKINSRALAYISILVGVSPAASKCLSGSFILEYEGDCDRETLVAVFKDQVFDVEGAKTAACDGVTAEQELDAQLAGASPSTTIEALCSGIYKDQSEVPFTDILKKGDNMEYEQAFYNGLTKLQEETETTYETRDRSATSVLKSDGELVRVHYQGKAQSSKTQWPALPNFKSSVTDSNGGATCTTNAAMCCWPRDRQARDNNGNCATDTYSENCVDKDPGDNTDLCFVDLQRGEAATGSQKTGIVGFPGDQNRDGGEGAIHCHGLAWANDPTDASARYKGNNLFFVSMFDHMYQRGYVENIPGAPMCGCVEQMPTVTRSDCTEIDVTERFKITYNEETNAVNGAITLIDVDFNACQGINRRNNDLYAYLGQLYYDGKITNKQWGEAGRIITNTDCDFAVEEALSKHQLQPGYDHDISTWTNVAGRDNMNTNGDDNNLQVAYLGAEALRLSLTTETSSRTQAPHGIIKRVCGTCDPTHKEIYYRRMTPIPKGFNLLYNILYQRNDGGGNNRWSVDFHLYSSYEDALNDENRWECPNNSFNYRASFYGECSPNGERVRDQYSVFNWSPGPRSHVGYYIAKGEDEGMVKVDTHAIRGRRYANGMATKSSDGNTIHLTGSGEDIWSSSDDFNYYPEELVEADFTAVVKVAELNPVSYHSWSKSGLMARLDLDPDSPHFSVFRTGGNGICTQARISKGSGSSHYGCVDFDPSTQSWVKIEKRMQTYTSFYGTEAADGEVTWTKLASKDVEALGDASYVGLAVSAASYHALEAVFEDFEVSQYYFPSAAPSVSMSPTYMAPYTDIASMVEAGQVSESGNGNWAVAASSYDIWGSRDSFRYVDFNVTGDVTVEMKVNAFEGRPTDGWKASWAKGGLMIRDNMGRGSRHYSLFVTGSNGLANQWREVENENSGHSKTHNDNPRPIWLQVKKVGDYFTSAFKYDEEGSQWIPFGQPKTMAFSSEFSVGIAVASNSWGNSVTLRSSDLSIEEVQTATTTTEAPVAGRKLRA